MKKAPNTRKWGGRSSPERMRFLANQWPGKASQNGLERQAVLHRPAASGAKKGRRKNSDGPSSRRGPKNSPATPVHASRKGTHACQLNSLHRGDADLADPVQAQ